MVGFLFGGNDKNLPKTPEELKAMREQAYRLMPMETPKNVGDGINSIAKALMYRGLIDDASAGEQAGRAEADKLFSDLMGGDTPAPATDTSIAPSAAPSTGGKADAGQFQDLFNTTAQKYGLPEDYLPITAKIESNFNPRAQNPNSSAGGMFQFIDSTAKQYGLSDKFDPAASTEAAARLAADNKKILENALGRPVTSSELYMAHQQGAGGALKALQNPNSQMASLVGSQAAGLNNLGGATGGQFAQKYASQFGQPYQVASNSADIPAPTPQNANQEALYSGVQQAQQANGTMPATQNPIQQVAQAVMGRQQPQQQSALADPAVQKLMQARNNPYLTEGQKSVIDTMLKQKMDAFAAPKYGFQAAGDNLYRTNPKTGEVEPIATPQKSTNDVREYEYAKQQHVAAGGDVKQFPNFKDYQVELKKAGASNVNIDQKTEASFDKELATGQAKAFTTMSEDARDAKADIAQIGFLREQIARNPGGFQGGMLSMASDLGIKLENADGIEAAKAVINQLVPKQRAAGSGTMSDRDVELFKSSLPKLSNTPEGNALIMDTMEGMSRYRLEQGRIADAVITGEMSRKDAQKALQALPDPMEGFKAFKKAQGGESAAPKQQSGSSAQPNKTKSGISWSIVQ